MTMNTLEARSLSRSDRDRIAAAAEKWRETAELRDDVRDLVTALLCQLADGRDAAVIDPEAYITPVEAARLVGVSRPLFNELLSEGRIPFFETPGGHRKVKMRDVQTYVTARDEIATDIAAARYNSRSNAAEVGAELDLSPDEAERLGFY